MDEAQEWMLIDTETTGIIKPIYIIEVYAQKMKGQHPIGDPVHLFINHNVDIPPESTAVHGYTKEFIQSAGINPWKAHRILANYIRNLPVCSHNLSYDWDRCLIPERRRLKCPQIGMKGFCTVQLFRRSLPDVENFKLEELRIKYSIGDKSHSAKADVLTVIELFKSHAFPNLERHGMKTFQDILNFSKETPIWKCREKLGLKPLIEKKSTPDQLLEILADTPNESPLAEKEIAILDRFIEAENDNNNQNKIIKTKEVEQSLKKIINTGQLNQQTKLEVFELIQPLLPIPPSSPSTSPPSSSTPSQSPHQTTKTITTKLKKEITTAKATQRQLNYLKILGAEFKKEISKNEASKLIDSIKSKITHKNKSNSIPQKFSSTDKPSKNKDKNIDI